MRTITATLTGIRPLLLHNGSLVDRRNPYTTEIREINKTRGKDVTDAAAERRDYLEWLGCLYFEGYGSLQPTGKAKLYIPADNIDAMLVQGAKGVRLAPKFKAGVICDSGDFPLEWAGPQTFEKMIGNQEFEHRCPVIIGKMRVIKVRPILKPGWKLKISISVAEEVINPKEVAKVLVICGSLVGLGDWRPKFGRFSVDDITIANNGG